MALGMVGRGEEDMIFTKNVLLPPAVKCTAPNQDNDDLHQEGEVAPSCEVTAQQSLSFLLMRTVSVEDIYTKTI